MLDLLSRQGRRIGFPRPDAVRSVGPGRLVQMGQGAGGPDLAPAGVGSAARRGRVGRDRRNPRGGSAGMDRGGARIDVDGAASGLIDRSGHAAAGRPREARCSDRILFERAGARDRRGEANTPGPGQPEPARRLPARPGPVRRPPAPDPGPERPEKRKHADWEPSGIGRTTAAVRRKGESELTPNSAELTPIPA